MAASKDAARKANGVLAQADRTILRLNKLLVTPGGLSALLSTLNYTAYILTHVHTKRVAATGTASAGPSQIALIAGLLSRTRTTLRLFGLVPMYAWARSLASGPTPGQDTVLYTAAATQCALYISFQFFENIAFLTDLKILPASATARWSPDGTTGRLWSISNRSWMLAVVCDLVRLAREAQLTREKRRQRGSAAASRGTQDRDADQRWWADLVSTLGWFPVALHYAEWNQGGIPGWNLGALGITGGIGGLGRTRSLWLSTKDL